MKLGEHLGGANAGAEIGLEVQALPGRSSERSENLAVAASSPICTWFRSQDGSQIGIYADGRILVITAIGTRIHLKPNDVVLIEKEGKKRVGYEPMNQLEQDELKLSVYPAKAQLSIIRKACGTVVFNGAEAGFILEHQHNGALRYSPRV